MFQRLFLFMLLLAGAFQVAMAATIPNYCGPDNRRQLQGTGENPELNCAPSAGLDRGLCAQRSKKCFCQEGRMLAWHKNSGCQCFGDCTSLTNKEDCNNATPLDFKAIGHAIPAVAADYLQAFAGTKKFCKWTGSAEKGRCRVRGRIVWKSTFVFIFIIIII